MENFQERMNLDYISICQTNPSLRECGTPERQQNKGGGGLSWGAIWSSEQSRDQGIWGPKEESGTGTHSHQSKSLFSHMVGNTAALSAKTGQKSGSQESKRWNIKESSRPSTSISLARIMERVPSELRESLQYGGLFFVVAVVSLGTNKTLPTHSFPQIKLEFY